MKNRSGVALTVVILCLGGVACGGGSGKSTPAATVAAPPASAVATPVDLRTRLPDMVLQLDKLGPAYAGYRLSEKAAAPNERVIRESHDPNKATKDLARFNRLDGYLLSFSSAGGSVATVANLHADAAGAAGYHATVAEDIRASVGRTAADGSTVKRADFFDPGRIGDAADAVVLTIAPPTGPMIYVTSVGLQRGAVLGSVVISGDATDHRDEAVRLAKLLDQQIQSVLAGQR